MKKFLVVMVAFLATLSLAACQEVAFDFEKGELVVGLECGYAPFNWTESESSTTNHPIANQSGAYAEGYDVQIAKLIADDLGLELVIKKIDWEGLIAALKGGDIDVIIAGMSPTETRKREISFSNAYYTSTHVAIVKNDSKYANAASLEDLRGAKGVGQIETVYAEAVDILVSNYGCTKIAERDSVPLCIQNILNDEVDFTIIERPVGLGVVAKNSSLKMLFGDIDNIFGFTAEKRDVSVGTRQNDTELTSKINDALAKISNETRETLMVNAVNGQPEEE